ncbi:MAG: hypothetical protein ABEJ70_00820 [Halobacteriaceae archaeon]
MTVRVVLTVVFALALVGAALPAVQDARHDAAARAGDRQVDALEDAVGGLVRSSDAVGPGLPAATRRVRLRVPARDAGSVGVAAVSVGGLPNDTAPGDGPRRDVVAVRVRGRPVRVVHVDADLRMGDVDAPDARPLVCRADCAVTLRYVRGPDHRVVVVERGRGFKYERAATPSRVRRAPIAP